MHVIHLKNTSISIRFKHVNQMNLKDHWPRCYLTERHIALFREVFCMPKYRRFVVEQKATALQSRMLLVSEVHCVMVL